MNVCTLWWTKNTVTNIVFQNFAILNFQQANVKIFFINSTQNKVVQHPKNIFFKIKYFLLILND
jgi:hypothetical protein